MPVQAMGVFVSALGIYEPYASTGTAIPASSANLNNPNAFYENSNLPQHIGGNHMQFSLGPNHSFKRGEHSANPHLTSTPECNDWLADTLRDQSAKIISRKTGQGQRAAEAVKMGRNGLTMAHLVNICRADDDFRAAFFKFCGGQLEGDPELVANLSRAINAVMQGAR
jgi:hypothetical protein